MSIPMIDVTFAQLRTAKRELKKRGAEGPDKFWLLQYTDKGELVVEIPNDFARTQLVIERDGSSQLTSR